MIPLATCFLSCGAAPSPLLIRVGDLLELLSALASPDNNLPADLFPAPFFWSLFPGVRRRVSTEVDVWTRTLLVRSVICAYKRGFCYPCQTSLPLYFSRCFFLVERTARPRTPPNRATHPSRPRSTFWFGVRFPRPDPWSQDNTI